MGFFERRKKAKATNAAVMRMGQDLMVKCYADMAIDQHMIRQGFMAMHEQRTEIAARPGELPAMPSVHVYLNRSRSDAPAWSLAILLIRGQHESRALAESMLTSAAQNIEELLQSAETAASIRSQGYVPTLIFFDPNEQGENAISVEELQPVAAN